MTFEILSGSTYVDITPYITIDGLEYQLSDIQDPDTGRTLDGLMHLGKVAEKDKWVIKCRTLSTSEVSTVIGLVSFQTITCRYLSPRTNTVVTKTMYVGDRKTSHCRSTGSVVKWSGLGFSLIEV